jgi:hypothetical protein
VVSLSNHERVRSLMAVTIGRCGPEDIDEVVRFIDDYWSRGHALVTSRRLLDWQHRNPDGGYSFVIARQNGVIIGMLGYISTMRFDPALAADNVVWLTTWKVRDDAGVAGVGLALLQYLASHERHVAIGAIGLNPVTRPIYQALGYRMGELQHYVLPNADVRRFALATLSPSRGVVPADASVGVGFKIVTVGADPCVGPMQDPGIEPIPRKTERYFLARYAAHPVYSYRVVALTEDDAVIGLMAMRLAAHDRHKALRIVDFLGNPRVIARIGGVVQHLLREFEVEYADVYNAGIEPAMFECAGFRRVDPDGSDVVPDHFEPFEPRNVRLWYSIKATGDPVLFKGDADQDRPSVLPKPAR